LDRPHRSVAHQLQQRIEFHTMEPPLVIKGYVDASNRHDVKSILACFSDDAVVRDERSEFQGKKMIENWIVRTIEKYEFQFKPLSVRKDDAEVVVAMEVSGTFSGSPITLDYHFKIKGDEILSLTID